MIFAIEWLLAGFVLLCAPFLLNPPIFKCEGKTKLECETYICNIKNIDEREKHLNWEDHKPATKEFNLICENDYINTIV